MFSIGIYLYVSNCGNAIYNNYHNIDDGKGGGGDPTQIPEFPTTAIPALISLGGYRVMRARKRG